MTPSSLFSLLTKNLLGVMLVLLLIVEGVSLAVSEGLVPVSEPILRVSEIAGPRIDAEAAAVVLQNTAAASTELFVFLLLAYGALLVFNFSYTFRVVTTPQWRLETLITLCALWAWWILDPDSAFLWFPFTILKIGLIFFACYLSLLEKRIFPEREGTTEA